jgi:phosphoglycerate-specific signal transduction histidine kinase
MYIQTYAIESAIKLISTNYLSKGIVLWYTIAPDLPVHVLGDLVRLRQILLNLYVLSLKIVLSNVLLMLTIDFQMPLNSQKKVMFAYR